jgi:hypothetical protein
VAYVFERASAAAAWRQPGIIEPPVTGNHADFASAFVLPGDDLLIGAPAVDSAGVVYHYRRERGAWTLSAVLRPPAQAGVAAFGQAISLAGDWLIVGASATDSAAGKVFSGRRRADGTWGDMRVADLPRVNARAAARTAVLLDGAKAYVGSPGAERVFVLARNANGSWSASDELRSPEAARGSSFGFALAIAGNEL